MSNRPNAKPQGANRVQDARAAASPRSYVLPILIGVVVVAAIAIALLAGRSSDDDKAATGSGGTTLPEKAAQPARIEGNSLPSFDPRTADAAIGQTLPTASGTGVDGQPVTVGPKGRPGVVMYLAHWCPHCQREVPLIVQWMRDGKAPAGFDLQAVTTAIDPAKPNYPPSAWLAKEGWTIPTLIDPDNKVAQAAGLSGFPYYIWYDADGKVVARSSGELPIATIEELNAKAMGQGGGSTPAAPGVSSPAPAG